MKIMREEMKSDEMRKWWKKKTRNQRTKHHRNYKVLNENENEENGGKEKFQNNKRSRDSFGHSRTHKSRMKPIFSM